MLALDMCLSSRKLCLTLLSDGCILPLLGARSNNRLDDQAIVPTTDQHDVAGDVANRGDQLNQPQGEDQESDHGFLPVEDGQLPGCQCGFHDAPAHG